MKVLPADGELRGVVGDVVITLYHSATGALLGAYPAHGASGKLASRRTGVLQGTIA